MNELKSLNTHVVDINDLVWDGNVMTSNLDELFVNNFKNSYIIKCYYAIFVLKQNDKQISYAHTFSSSNKLLETPFEISILGRKALIHIQDGKIFKIILPDYSDSEEYNKKLVKITIGVLLSDE
jgi:hypothetical protein